MKDLRSARRLIKIRQRRDKSAIDPAVRGVQLAKPEKHSSGLSPYTASGLAVEAQVRKAWQPWSTGLSIF